MRPYSSHSLPGSSYHSSFSVVRRLSSATSHALLERLVSGGDSEIRRLVSESPEVAEQRAELILRKKRLEEAKKVLLALGRTV